MKFFMILNFCWLIVAYVPYIRISNLNKSPRAHIFKKLAIIQSNHRLIIKPYDRENITSLDHPLWEINGKLKEPNKMEMKIKNLSSSNLIPLMHLCIEIRDQMNQTNYSMVFNDLRMERCLEQLIYSNKLETNISYYKSRTVPF